MISLSNVAIEQGGFAMQGISLEIPQGQYGVLMGKTGSGKTTLLEVICGLRPVVSGSIRLMGREISRLKPAARGVGYVPQDASLFSLLTVRQHLEFAPVVRRWSRQAIAQRVEELAALLQIGDLLDRRPKGLSGGEAQRVALGRALAMRPGVLLLDEPLSALDENTRQEMYELLGSLRRQSGATVLHVTHNRAEAELLADRVFQLHDGAVVEVPLKSPLRAPSAAWSGEG